MTDTITKAPANLDEINVLKPAEVSYWADKFGVSNVKLKATVNTVGPSVKAIRNYLAKR